MAQWTKIRNICYRRFGPKFYLSSYCTLLVALSRKLISSHSQNIRMSRILMTTHQLARQTRNALIRIGLPPTRGPLTIPPLFNGHILFRRHKLQPYLILSASRYPPQCHQLLNRHSFSCMAPGMVRGAGDSKFPH